MNSKVAVSLMNKWLCTSVSCLIRLLEVSVTNGVTIELKIWCWNVSDARQNKTDGIKRLCSWLIVIAGYL